MVEFKHLLATTDMTDASRPALACAAAFASGYGANLSLLHVVPTFDAIQMPPGTLGDSVQMVYPSSRDEVIATMQRHVESAGLSAASLYLMAEAGDPVDTIVDQAISIPADLVVMGSHGRSGFNRLLYGSVTEQVLHRSPCPVLTVPSHGAAAPPEARFTRILCAMDFSPAAMQALGFALELGRQFRGLVIVQHAIEWLSDEEPRVHAHFNVAEYRTYLLEDARARLDQLLASEDRTGVDVQPVVSVGRAYREILKEVAARAADLIVMGVHGRGGLGQALTGSATNQVVRAAACPVLTVRARLDQLLASEDRTGVDVQPVVSVGRAYREILKEVEARAADLIVMGVHGRGGLGQALTGSATNQVVRAAPCPVLTVRAA